MMLVPIAVGLGTLGERCGHGLTSMPRESASEGFLNELLELFGYPSGSAAALLGGELHLRYCSGKFACRVPTWGLLARGHVQGLVAEFAGVGGGSWSSHVDRAQLLGLVGGARVSGGRRILGSVKRVRLHRKTPAHLSRWSRDGSSQSRPRVWKRLRVAEGPRFRHNGAKVPRLHQGDETLGLQDRVGVGLGIWGRAGPRLQTLHEQV